MKRILSLPLILAAAVTLILGPDSAYEYEQDRETVNNSFEQPVEKPLGNSTQTEEIPSKTLENHVGNGGISANSVESTQITPENSETPEENEKFSTFSENFSTGSAADTAPVEKSPLPGLALTKVNPDRYEDTYTDTLFSGVWTIDAVNRTAELVEFTGKPELFQISMASEGISVDYLANTYIGHNSKTIQNMLAQCISYEFGFPIEARTADECRDTLNELVSASVVKADGTVQEITFDSLGYWQGNNHYWHSYTFSEPLYDDVTEFRFSLHLPDWYVAEHTPKPYEGLTPLLPLTLNGDAVDYSYSGEYSAAAICTASCSWTEDGLCDGFSYGGQGCYIDYTITLTAVDELRITPLSPDFPGTAYARKLNKAAKSTDTDMLQSLFRLEFTTLGQTGQRTVFAKSIEKTDDGYVVRLTEPLANMTESFTAYLMDFDAYRQYGQVFFGNEDRFAELGGINVHLNNPGYGVISLLSQMPEDGPEIAGSTLTSHFIWGGGSRSFRAVQITVPDEFSDRNQVCVLTPEGFYFTFGYTYDIIASDDYNLYISRRYCTVDGNQKSYTAPAYYCLSSANLAAGFVPVERSVVDEVLNTIAEGQKINMHYGTYGQKRIDAKIETTLTQTVQDSDRAAGEIRFTLTDPQTGAPLGLPADRITVEFGHEIGGMTDVETDGLIRASGTLAKDGSTYIYTFDVSDLREESMWAAMTFRYTADSGFTETLFSTTVRRS